MAMSSDILSQIQAIVGSGRVTTADAVGEFEFPWATHDTCQAKAIVYPQTTDEVAEILRLCNAAQQTVVPFGGATNLVQGCATTPDDIALSLQKMNQVEEIDAAGRTLTAQAGVTMETAQKDADHAGLFFPVDIGARGNCQLGGIVSTNAGGSKVIRYGMTRESVLGLEAVLADGTVVSSMNRYLKNNSGFDLKQLFIGSEGVLGVITRVVFRLGTKATTHNVALIACDKFDDVVGVLRCANDVIPNTLTAFEVMWNEFYELAVQPRGRLTAPVEPGANYYVIVESMGVDEEHDSKAFETLLEALAEQELLVDGTLAKSGKEIEQIWAIRDEVEPVIDGALNFDVSLKSADVGDYVAKVDAAIHERFADANVVGFGHLGDNNVHISVSMADRDEQKVHDVEEIVYGQLAAYDGAVSAEHGIGLTKREWLPISRTPAEIDLMVKLKSMLDPNNILNPGKVVSAKV
jgi:FAD/FMN-containing dehydrogenase